MGAGVAQAFQLCLDGVYLILAVCLVGTVDQADVLCIRTPLFDHGRLLIQRGQIRGAGDVAAHCAGKICNPKRDAVLGDRGAQNRDICGRGCSCLQRRGCVRHDKVHIFGHKGIGDRRAGSGVIGRILVIKGHLAGEPFVKRILKAFSGCIQCGMCNQL